MKELNAAQPKELKPFLEMSMVERRAYVSGRMLEGTHPDESHISVRQILDRGLHRMETEPEYYQYRIQLENIDPAVSVVDIKTNQARFFLEAYGPERAKPFLSSYTWVCAYFNSRYQSSASPETKNQIKAILLERGVDQVCEEISSRTPAQIRRMNLSVMWGRSFVDIFGLKALSGLPPAVAAKIKSIQVEDALGL